MSDIPQQQSNPPNKPKRNYDKKVHGKRYTLARKLAVKSLLNSGMSPTEIERTEGIDRSTVYSVMKDKKIALLAPKQVDEIKRSLIGAQYGNAYRAQEKISDEKLQAMNAYQLSLISSINIDKARLMENLSTENVAHRGYVETASDYLGKMKDKFGGFLSDNV